MGSNLVAVLTAAYQAVVSLVFPPDLCLWRFRCTVFHFTIVACVL